MTFENKQYIQTIDEKKEDGLEVNDLYGDILDAENVSYEEGSKLNDDLSAALIDYNLKIRDEVADLGLTDGGEVNVKEEVYDGFIEQQGQELNGLINEYMSGNKDILTNLNEKIATIGDTEKLKVVLEKYLEEYELANESYLDRLEREEKEKELAEEARLLAQNEAKKAEKAKKFRDGFYDIIKGEGPGKAVADATDHSKNIGG